MTNDFVVFIKYIFDIKGFLLEIKNQFVSLLKDLKSLSEALINLCNEEFDPWYDIIMVIRKLNLDIPDPLPDYRLGIRQVDRVKRIYLKDDKVRNWFVLRWPEIR